MSWRAALALVLLAIAGCLSPRDLTGKHESLDSGTDAGEGAAPDAGSADAAEAAQGLTIHTTALPAAEAGVAYLAKVTGAGDDPAAALHWTVVSAWLPPGISPASLSGPDLTLSGTPQVAGDYPITFELSDGRRSTKLALTLTVAPSRALGLPAVLLPPARVGEPYETVLPVVHQDQEALSWHSPDQSLPPGLTVEQRAGSSYLTGTLTSAGAYSIYLEARTASQRVAPRLYALDVRPAKAWLGASVQFESPDACKPAHSVVVDVSDFAQPGPPRTFVYNKFRCVSVFDFSPSGDWLLFVEEGKGASSAGLVDLRVPADRELTATYLTSLPWRRPAPSWSPDGSHLLYWADDPELHEGRVHVVDLSGDAPVDVELKGTFADLGSWSPDGSRLALLSGDHTVIRVLRIDQLEASDDYPAGDTQTVGDLHWVASSRALVYALSSADGHTQLARQELGESARLLLTPPLANASRMLISPRGRHVALVDAESHSLHVVEIGSGYPTHQRFALPDDAQNLVLQEWSDDGQQALLFDRDRGYFAAALDGGSVMRVPSEKLVPEATDELAWLRFAPGGMAFLAGVQHGTAGGIIQPKGGLYQLRGDVATQLFETVGAPQVEFAGPTLLVVFDELFNLVATPQRVVEYAQGMHVMLPRTDPARERIYFYASDDRVYLVNARTPEAPLPVHTFTLDTPNPQPALFVSP